MEDLGQALSYTFMSVFPAASPITLAESATALSVKPAASTVAVPAQTATSLLAVQPVMTVNPVAVPLVTPAATSTPISTVGAMPTNATITTTLVTPTVGLVPVSNKTIQMEPTVPSTLAVQAVPTATETTTAEVHVTPTVAVLPASSETAQTEPALPSALDAPATPTVPVPPLSQRVAAEFRELLFYRLDAHGSGGAASASRAAKALVFVEDHGTGSVALGRALETHPCVIDMSETFVATDEEIPSPLWISLPPDNRPGIFSANGTLVGDVKPTSVAYQIRKAIARGALRSDTPLDVPGLYDSLPLDLGEYYMRIATHVCAHIDSTTCPSSDQCVTAFIFFPQYVGARTGANQLDSGSASELAPKQEALDAQEVALEVWGRSIQQLLNNPSLGVLHIHRDEKERQLAVFNRFHGANTSRYSGGEEKTADFFVGNSAQFDCGRERKLSLFERRVFELVPSNRELDIEHCWTSPGAAQVCLQMALMVVNLSFEVTEAGLQLLNPMSEYHYDDGTEIQAADLSCNGGGVLHQETLSRKDASMLLHLSTEHISELS